MDEKSGIIGGIIGVGAVIGLGVALSAFRESRRLSGTTGRAIGRAGAGSADARSRKTFDGAYQVGRDRLDDAVGRIGRLRGDC